MNATLFERLSKHRMVGSLPQSEIEWVASHGVFRHFDSGVVMYSKSVPIEGVGIVLDGHMAIYVDQGTGRRKMMEWRGGEFSGLMPYSRLVTPPGDVVTEEPTELVIVRRDDMPEMIRECHELTTMLVHVMLDRARHFTSSYLHDEKLVSLGKLAAGLAHELNNPVSAIARSANALSATRSKASDLGRTVGSSGLTPEQIDAMVRVRDACLSGCDQSVLSPLQQEERERSIARWLKNNGANTAVAEDLAEAGVTFEMLEQFATTIKGPALNAALGWIAADSSMHRLTSEIQIAASRIHDLVAAVKGFTEMDRASVLEAVDIEQGLANTLAVLRSKAKDKSVELRMNVEKDLPRVNGFGGELNQVWVNLIDNALDAVSEGGRVELTAGRKGDNVVVVVMDDGPGIPAQIRNRIFDPFFTTKPVGQGTGLGLDIVQKLILRHKGQIELDSEPGRTQFRITLPVAGTH